MKLMAIAALILVGCAGQAGSECTPVLAASYMVTLETPAGCSELPAGQVLAFKYGVVDARGAETRLSADSCTSVVTTTPGDVLDLSWAEDWSSANGTYRIGACAAPYGVKLARQ